MTAGVEGNAFIVFVPGRNDIKEIPEELASVAVEESLQKHNLSAFCINTALGSGDRLPLSTYKTPEEGRQIILATTAAETSITIPDVSVVIDSATTLHRTIPIQEPQTL
jgi:HrpA-like RNA helicase